MGSFPVFIALVIAAAIALWFLCAFLFKPLGKFFFRLWKEANDAMNEEKDNKKDKSEKE